jgi:hypothetical protein
VEAISCLPATACCLLFLVVTFLTFQTANIFYGNAIHFTGPYIVVEFFVNAIEFVACAVIVIKIHLAFAVAVDTPAHA